jgi:hypothetical protein
MAKYPSSQSKKPASRMGMKVELEKLEELRALLYILTV